MPTLFEDAVKLIRTGACELGLGWEFLYCPPSLLSSSSRLWFIGINPGGTREDAVESFEDGNAYYVDKPWSADGEVLRKQVKSFFDLLACALDNGKSGEKVLNEALTSNFCPFNSDTWRTFPKAERRKAVNLSRELWGGILRQLSPREIQALLGHLEQTQPGAPAEPRAGG